MSTTIDSKVVEMKFQNSNFEKNVRQSMNTLEAFKKNLDFSKHSKGFEDLGRATNSVDFNPLNSGLNTVKSGFSALEVVAITAISKITSGLMDSTAALLNQFSIIQMAKDGFSEYELKMNSVQTIMSGTGESLENVMSALQDLNHYADKTIYIFSDMTSNIGKFTNAGVKLETAVAAMKGISNEAALSGASAMEASRAMYNIAQALGTGYMQLIDWKSIENANMATMEFKNNLIQTAKEIGTLSQNSNATAENFRETLKDKWLTSDVLLKTLEKYADETTELGQRAYRAAQDIKTFHQMIDTLKEAMGSGWADTWEIIVGNFDEAKSLFTSLSSIFDELISASTESRNSFLKGALETKHVSLNDWVEIRKAGYVTKDIQLELIQTARDEGVAIDAMMDKHKNFAATLQEGWLTYDIFNKTLKRISRSSFKARESVEGVAGSVSDLGKIVDDVILGKFGNGKDRVDALTKAGYDYKTVQDLVNQKIKTGTIDIQNLSTAQMKNLGYTEEQVAYLKDLAKQAEETGTPLNELLEKLNGKSGRELAIESLMNSLHALIDTCRVMKQAWSEIFPPKTSDDLYHILYRINEFTDKLTVTEEKADKLRRTFKGLFAVLDIFRIVAGGIVGAILRGIANVLKEMNIDILDVTASVGDNLVALRDWIKEHDYVTAAVEKVINVIVEIIKHIKEFAETLWNMPEVQKKLNDISNAFDKMLKTINRKLPNAKESINKFTSAISNITLEDVAQGLVDFGEAVKEFALKVKFEGPKAAIEDFFETVRDKFPKFFGFFDSMKEHIGYIPGFLDATFPKISEHFRKFISTVNNIATSIVNWIGPINSLSDFLGLLLKVLEILSLLEFVKIVKNVTKTFEAIKGAFNAAKKWFKAHTILTYTMAMINIAGAVYILASAMVKLSSIPSGKLLSSLGVITALTVLITGMVVLMNLLAKKIDVNNMRAIIANSATFVGIAAAVYLIAKSLSVLDSLSDEKIKRNLEMLAGIVAGLAVLSVAFNLLSFKSSANSFKAVLAFAIGAYAIVAALEKLERINPEKITENVNALKGIFVSLAILFATSKLAGKNAGKVGLAVIGMAVALNLMVGSLWFLGKMKPSTLMIGIKGIKEIFLVFIEVMAFSKLAGENAGKAGSMILKMSAALVLITGCIWILSKIDEKDLKNSIGVILTIGAMFTAFTAITSLTGDAKLGGSAKLLTSLAVTIGILCASILILSIVPADKLKKSIAAISLIMLSLAPVLAGIGSINTGKGTGNMIVLAVIIAELASLLVTLSSVPNPDKLIPSAIALSTVLLALSASLKILSKSEFKEGQLGNILGSVMVLTLVLMVLSALFSDLSNNMQNPGNVIVLSASVSLALMAIAECVTILSKAEFKESKLTNILLTLTILTAVVMALSITFAEFSDNIHNPGNVIVLATGVSEALMAIAGCVVILSNAEFEEKQLGKILASVAVLGLVFTGIAFVLSTFSDKIKNPAKALTMALAVSEVLLALSTSCVILSKANNIGNSALKGAAIMGVIAAGLIVVFNYFGQDLPDPAKAIGTATAIGELLLAISGAMAIASIAGKAGPEAVAVGIAGILGFILGIGTLMAAYGELNALAGGDLTGFIQDAIPALEAIGKGIGEFVSGLLVGFTDNLPKVAEDLSDFMLKLTPFLVGLGVIKMASITAGLALVGLLASFLAVEIINGIASFVEKFTGTSTSMSDFADDLAEFADAIVAFSEKVDGNINESAITAAANAGTLLAKLESNLPKHGGIIQDWVGETESMSKFAKGIKDFGEAIVTFSNTVAPNGTSLINESAVQAAANAGLLLSELEGNLSKHDGFWQKMFGDNDLATFSEGLDDFGTAIVSFSKTIAPDGTSLVNSEAIQTVSDAIEPLVEIEGKLKNHDGAWQKITGDNSLTDFAAGLVEFGKSLIEFNNAITMAQVQNAPWKDRASILNIDAINDVIDITGRLSELENGLKNIDGIVQLFSGSQSLDDFGLSLSDYSNKLKIFGDNAGAVNYDSAYEGIQLTSDILTLFNEVSGFDQTAVEGLYSAIYAWGDIEIGSFTSPFVDSKADIIIAVNTFFNNFKDAIENSPSNEELANTMKSMFEDNIIQIIMNKIGNADSAGDKTTIYGTGFELIKVFNTAILTRLANQEYSPYISMQIMCDRMVGIINGKFESFKQAGVYVVDGFIEGINSKMADAQAAADALGNLVKDAIAKALDEHSPSKATYKEGAYAAIGLINALTDYNDEVYGTAEDLGYQAKSGLADAIKNISESIDGDMNLNPTISPVLDLSNVKKGFKGIDTMFSRNQVLSASSSFEDGKKTNDTNNQNGSENSGSVINNFTQNNYSPKALSRYEIYRQTRNQLNQMKGVVKNR